MFYHLSTDNKNYWVIMFYITINNTFKINQNLYDM